MSPSKNRSHRHHFEEQTVVWIFVCSGVCNQQPNKFCGSCILNVVNFPDLISTSFWGRNLCKGCVVAAEILKAWKVDVIEHRHQGPKEEV